VRKNPKSETQNKAEKAKKGSRVAFLIACFEFSNCFEFRRSDFGFELSPVS